ncbi:hypothetical protein ABIA06_000204 [Bradyrhizobium yuanmingense]
MKSICLRALPSARAQVKLRLGELCPVLRHVHWEICGLANR